MGPRRTRIRWAAALVALLFGASPAAGAPPDPMDPANCLYPLGPAAENGRFSLLSAGNDPEMGIVDTSFSGATKTFDTVVSIWDTLYSVYDGRFRLGDGGPGQQGGSKHNIFVKAWTDNGWNSTVDYPSNPDVKNATPEGNNLNPRAAAFQDKLWVAFSKESSFNFQTDGVPIVMRGRSSDGTWGPYLFVTEPHNSSDNQIPNLIAVGDRLLIAWVHIDLVSNIGDTVIQGRFFDGALFGPVFNISRPADRFSDNYFGLASDGVRAAATWLSTEMDRPAPSMAPKFAFYDGSTWSAEVDLWSQNDALSWGVAAEFFGGKLYLGFDTTDERLNPQADYGLFLRVAELPSLSLSQVQTLSDAQSRGDDYLADFAVFEDRLHVVWVSADDNAGAGADLDLIHRTFDGSHWSAPRDLTAQERYQDDEYVARFVEHEGALHVHWITLLQPPGLTARDQRAVTLMVERGARWWDGLEAATVYAAPPVDGANVTAFITVRNAAGVLVGSPWYSVRFANGSWAGRVEASASTIILNFTYNATPLEPFKVLACGKPIEFQAPTPPAGAPNSNPSGSLAMWATVALSAAAAVGASFLVTRRWRQEQG